MQNTGIYSKRFSILYLMLLAFLFLISSCNKKNLFRVITPAHSGIHFSNQIIQSDSINVLDFENVYNGGGVGIGDFNNDGLQDVYFTGNLVSNKLYLNKGNFKFQDITNRAGVTGNGRWCRGATVVDINNDGLMDIYVSASVKKNPQDRRNLLYINQGMQSDSIPLFKEMAAEYNLDDTTHSTMSYFFDYDNDGDLDVYIVVNQIIRTDFPNKFRPRLLKGEHPSTGRLYRNDWNDSLHHPLFTNVSAQAGITIEGYGHSASITDINKDGWKDILVSNDYLSQDILYINNHDGTFTDKVGTYFKHTSANAMGNDVADINNDGLQDVIELDMNPEDNYRKKMMMNANSYQTYQNSDYFGLQYQYVRNTVQLNQGPRMMGNDSIGDPVFSDIGFFSGLAETDWSWTPLVVDFDNDGFRDVIITNGFPKDVTDHDFRTFRDGAFSIASKKQLLDQIPEVKIHNYAFHNNGNTTFKNVTEDWGLMTPSFSSGAAYADLDNDGDLDVVVNNINDSAALYENTINSQHEDHHYLQLHLEGDTLNRNGIGTWIELYYQGQQQVVEQMPYRGYLSTHQINPHFGLGKVTMIDSVVIKWPNGLKQVLNHVATDQVLNIQVKDASQHYNWMHPNAKPLFTDITNSAGIDYIHEEADYIDFNIQRLLPHKFSDYGPALAVGDLDGNGFDDLVAGGSYSQREAIFLQKANGKFLLKELIPEVNTQNQHWEDMGILLFDADGDKDLDIYLARGGYENKADSKTYQDRLFLNDGKANFTLDSLALPVNVTSKSCVRAADFDKDGDLDLFVAGRVEPWKYPKPVSSFIYRNDSKDGLVKFTDVTSSIAPSLTNIGLICDAVWTDFDNDGWIDLVLAGEWMPVTFLRNEKSVFKNITAKTGVQNDLGWWGSILPGDFDNDGDIDYVVSNLGLNSFYRATMQYPVKIYAKDFDNNGSYDAVPTLFIPSSLDNPQKREYPVHTRDDLTKQMIGFRSKFKNYKSYATTGFDQMFSEEELKDALILKATNFNHCLFKNKGNNTFEIIPLPLQSQYSCINGMIAEDFDGDGNLDLLTSGNDYGTEVSVGRYDACNGLFFKGNGKGAFVTASIVESGIFIPGNGKALVKLRDSMGNCLVAASQNRGPLKMFRNNSHAKILSIYPDDVAVALTLRNGKIRRQELNFGASFLSQSGRFINLSKDVVSLEIINVKGEKRNIQLN